jgi:hypothetical protein
MSYKATSSFGQAERLLLARLTATSASDSQLTIPGPLS